MTARKKALVSAVLGAAVTAGTVAAVTPASAMVACNRFGECWHVRERLVYPPRLGVTWYPDTWTIRQGWRWRGDRFDHGYWAHGHWRRF